MKEVLQKMKKFLLSIFVLFFASGAFAELQITNAYQTVKFTNDGRQVHLKITVKETEHADKNYTANWAYSFNPSLKIEIVSAQALNVKNVDAKFDPISNSLTFNFTKPENVSVLEFDFVYNQKLETIPSYNRHEFVWFDNFLQGAQGSLTVEVPASLEVYSTNEAFKKQGNIYSWQGIIAKQGFNDTFWLTLRKARWKVGIVYEFDVIKQKNTFESMVLTFPHYLNNAGYRIEEYNLLSNLEPQNFKAVKTDDKITFEMVGNSIITPLIQFGVEAIVVSDFDNKFWTKLKPENALKIDDNTRASLQKLISSIQFADPEDTSPLYIKLAKWTNSAIKYDLNYSGKKMSTIEILNLGSGVCEHYTQVYNDLLRAAGIPSMMAAGMSFDYQTQQFDSAGHAWNFVYVEGKWIPIDTTWGIYSGKLPISHIFFNFYEKDEWEFHYSYKLTKESKTQPEFKVRRSVEFLK